MNKKLKVFFGLFFFIYFATYLFSLTFSKDPKTKMHEKVIVAVSSPLQNLVTFTYDRISSVFSNYFFLVGAAKRNEILEKENGELRQKLVYDDELKMENDRLRTLLQLALPKQYHAIHAERVASTSNEFERSIRVNKGSNELVEVGMSVVNTQGIVGQVAKVFGKYSDILLLTDKANAVDVIIQRTRSRGILKGFTQHQLSFEFLAVDEDLQVGDVVISSGLDGVYPEGIPIGAVSALSKNGRRLFLTATVDPYVNFSKIEEVRMLEKKND